MGRWAGREAAQAAIAAHCNFSARREHCSAYKEPMHDKALHEAVSKAPRGLRRILMKHQGEKSVKRRFKCGPKASLDRILTGRLGA